MSEVVIFNNLNNTLSTTALFFLGWAFLLWVAARAVTVAIEGNAGIITKIVTTIFGLTALWQFNFSMSYVPWSFEGAAHQLLVLKEETGELSLRSEAFLDSLPVEVSASEAPVFSLIPSDPFYGLFILSALFLIVGRLWIGSKA